MNISKCKEYEINKNFGFYTKGQKIKMHESVADILRYKGIIGIVKKKRSPKKTEE